MNLNELRNKAYRCAIEHGWHDTEYSDQHFLMLLITELAEAVEADRQERHADIDAFNKYSDSVEFKENFERQIKNTVEDELSDVIIRLLDLAGALNINLELAGNLIKQGAIEITETFPEFCFLACGSITRDEYSSNEMINYTIAGIVAYCQQKNIDIMWHIEKKMEYNELRSFRHGNKRY